MVNEGERSGVPKPIQEYIGFFDKYRNAYETEPNRRLTNFPKNFERLKQYFSVKVEETKKLAKEEAPNFNIFRI
jgi:hypothetical protein